ncbi:unnamed protein product (macronuclear) [Paramecium tetraurelia]|uniref:GOLD domain-containing protein n=1 Tax=Paramecium tetraurelia TaxID=5888 RepID=A0DWV6_PARTE|nr:uncharacterized protein GSPATT00021166001 [Paramecium tetraurelia]CAK87523.1 unnamed protein product [Paramecium tetraurelia]|eukprot:XP_001454920.1 hypothetical protein (macronuclear) [Paramecium tetraurelia strain d4-2]
MIEEKEKKEVKQMKESIKTLQANLIDKLENSKMTPQKITELIKMVQDICASSIEFQDVQFKRKEIELEDKLKLIDNDLIQLIELNKKKRGFMNFFSNNNEIIEKQQEICSKILEFFNETQSYFQDCALITSSAFVRQKQYIDIDFINIETNFIVNHPKFLPIKSKMNLMLKKDLYTDVYELDIYKRDLIKKIIDKAQQPLNETQIQYLEQFDKKINNQFVFKVSYSRQTQLLALLLENGPYIITTNPEQNRIYLCKGMSLKFFPNQTLKVLETNLNVEIKQHFQGVTVSNGEPLNQNVQIANYGYIKFWYQEIDTKMEKQQTVNKDKNEQQPMPMPSKGSTFEFYLKNSSQSLADTVPSIHATLYHDTEGFYILPIKTEFQTYYHLYYDNYIQIETEKYNFGFQIKGKGWIQVITEKMKSEHIQ